MCWDEERFPGRGRRSKGTGGGGLDRGASHGTCLCRTTQAPKTCWAFTSLTLGAGGILTPPAQQGQPLQQLYLVPGARVLPGAHPAPWVLLLVAQWESARRVGVHAGTRSRSTWHSMSLQAGLGNGAGCKRLGLLKLILLNV